MFRKNYFTFLLAFALFLIGGAAASAQTAPVRGQVVLKKADGTTQPVPDAAVEIYRTDVKGKLPASKTDKKGYFNFAGLPVGANFALSISAPGIKPEIFPNIKAGMEGVIVNVTEGDGKKYTEEEVRQALSAPPSSNSSASAKPAEMTADQKKAQEEYQKQVAAVTEKNKKIAASTEIIKKAVEEGSKAFSEKNYDLAIAKFDEGINADPEYAGSAPVLLNNKGAALRNRAVITYNDNVKAADVSAKVAAMTKVKQDLANAVESYSKSFTILKAAPAGVVDPKAIETNKIEALRGAKETLRLMAQTEQVDTTKTDSAKTLISEYVVIETDQAKKVEAQRVLGDIFRVAGDSDNAIAEYKKVLEIEPNDPDALAGLGLSLVNLGYINSDKTKFQEGTNYLQRYIDTASAGHRYLDDAKGLIETLKKEQNVAPQKSSKAPAKKKS